MIGDLLMLLLVAGILSGIGWLFLGDSGGVILGIFLIASSLL